MWSDVQSTQFPELHTISSQNTEIEHNSAESTQHSQEQLQITAHFKLFS